MPSKPTLICNQLGMGLHWGSSSWAEDVRWLVPPFQCRAWLEVMRSELERRRARTGEGTLQAVTCSHRLRDEFFRAMADKAQQQISGSMDQKARQSWMQAKIDDTEFLAEQMRLLHGQLQMLWQNFEKLIAGEKDRRKGLRDREGFCTARPFPCRSQTLQSGARHSMPDA